MELKVTPFPWHIGTGLAVRLQGMEPLTGRSGLLAGLVAEPLRSNSLPVGFWQLGCAGGGLVHCLPSRGLPLPFQSPMAQTPV
jgi:hypothetical protein